MKYKICSCLNSPKGSSSTLRATASGVGVVVASKLEGFVLVVGLFVVPIRMRKMKMKNTIFSKKKKVVLIGLLASGSGSSVGFVVASKLEGFVLVVGVIVDPVPMRSLKLKLARAAQGLVIVHPTANAYVASARGMALRRISSTKKNLARVVQGPVIVHPTRNAYVESARGMALRRISSTKKNLARAVQGPVIVHPTRNAYVASARGMALRRMKSWL